MNAKLVACFRTFSVYFSQGFSCATCDGCFIFKTKQRWYFLCPKISAGFLLLRLARWSIILSSLGYKTDNLKINDADKKQNLFLNRGSTINKINYYLRIIISKNTRMICKLEFLISLMNIFYLFVFFTCKWKFVVKASSLDCKEVYNKGT